MRSIHLARLGALTALLGLLASSVPGQPLVAQEQEALVVSGTDGLGAELHVEPNAASEVVAVLPEGVLVYVIGPDVWADGAIWRNVQDADGNGGYVDNQLLASPQPVPILNDEPLSPLIPNPSPLEGEGLGMRAVTPSTPQRTAMPSTPARQSSTTATLPEVPVPRVAAQVAPTPTSAPGTKQVTIARGGRLFQTSTFEQETAPDGRPMMAGSLLVKFRSSASQATRDVVHQAAGALAVERLGLADLARVQIRPGTVTQALAAYRGRADVERAEPDYVLRKTFTPNDPSFGQQYGMAKIQAPAAWDVTHSSFGIRIAILDCGVYSSSSSYISPDGLPGHPDVRSKVVLETNFTTSSFGADDLCDHGTHVAGIAAASTNNGIGVAGVGFDAAIMNGKVLDDTGQGPNSWIINGITWATNNGAKVINMSLGGPGACSFSMQSAISYAWTHGVVVAAAAGNDGTSGAESPANCANVLGVAATDQNDAKASFSNFGPNVDVAAPGVSILSTDFVGTYETFSGTSQATPHVSGLAALVWATGFGTGNQAVVDRITGYADQIAGTGSLWTYGRINASAAVGPNCSPRPNVGVSAVAASGGRLQATVVAGGGSLQSLQFGTATNALIDIGSQVGATGSFTFTPAAGTTQLTFFVRRATPGQPTTVPFTVVDGCGPWQTLVGGGAGAF